MPAIANVFHCAKVNLLTLLPSLFCAWIFAAGVSISLSSWAQGNQDTPADSSHSEQGEIRTREKKEEELRRLSQEIERRLGSGTRYVTPVTPESSLRDYVKVIEREIEQKGTNNFPKRNGVSVYGRVLMALTVNAKGQIERAELLEGADRFLEAHARKLLREIVVAPFPPDFPAATQRIVFAAPFDYRRE